MIIVTGGAGFIGSNLIQALNEQGKTDILVVDDLTDGHKFQNLVDCQTADYIDSATFLAKVQSKPQCFDYVETIFHQGACSTTTEWNGRYMMENNYEYSKILLHYAVEKKIPFIYASSAAVYGKTLHFREEPEYERPLNVYGYSKLLFDQYVRRILPKTHSQIVGLRYFNVYGPRENHKGSMASVAFHLHHQLLKEGSVKLFEGSDGYGNGEQRRDFIYVADVAKVNLWFMKNPSISGVFNVGTGSSQPFNDVARAVLEFHGQGELSYIPFPAHLKGSYQSFTEADLTSLRKVGYTEPFNDVNTGVKRYLSWLSNGY